MGGAQFPGVIRRDQKSSAFRDAVTASRGKLPIQPEGSITAYILSFSACTSPAVTSPQAWPHMRLLRKSMIPQPAGYPAWISVTTSEEIDPMRKWAVTKASGQRWVTSGSLKTAGIDIQSLAVA